MSGLSDGITRGPAGTGLRLRVESGGDRGTELQLPDDRPFVIGRGDDVDFRMFDDRASRRHCELQPARGATGVILRDLESRNGTWIAGRRIEDERELAPGDRFSVGGTTFRLMAAGMREKETVVTLGGATSIKSSIAAPQQDQLASRVDQSARLAALFRLQSSLDAERGLDSLLAGALQRLVARELLGADTAAITVFSDTADAAPRLMRRWPVSDRPLDIDPSLMDRVRKNGEALLLTDLASSVHNPGAGSGDRTQPLVAALLVPLTTRQQTLAMLYADRRSGAAFTPDDLSFAVQLASVLAPGLRTAIRVDDLRESAAAGNKRRPGRRGEATAASSDSDDVAIVGNSDALLACLRTVAKVAPTDVAVMISGETGTGKELFARALHDQSALRDGPFVALNCAAIPADLLESELFGHEAGAFTGANRARPGKLELADGGTLFLDEIGETPPEMQAKLLRVLQERRFWRLGGQSERTAHFRLVTASNRDLQEEVRAGRFREDLLFRIRVVTLPLPPLRDRREDIPELAAFFLASIAHRIGRKARAFSPAAMDALSRWNWPGNVRELENVVERAVVLAEDEVIGPDALPAEIANPDAVRPVLTNRGAAAGNAVGVWPDDGFPEVLTIREAERRAIITALRHTGKKKGETAQTLGISWPTLNKKIRDYDIDVDAL
ncbi:MAG: sigma 54-interacting transcriptional regulator [Planctomycetota bacterium]